MRYPNFNNAGLISIDIETYDPGLIEYGPSNYRKKKGYILGVAIAFGDHAEYYNYTDYNDIVYITEVLGSNTPKIGHSLIYDVDWLESQGIKVNGGFIDVMIAEALIDNNQKSYSLDSIAKNYLQETKEDTGLIVALNAIGIKPTKTKPAQNYLHLLDHDQVREYAVQGRKDTIKIMATYETYNGNHEVNGPILSRV